MECDVSAPQRDRQRWLNAGCAAAITIFSLWMWLKPGGEDLAGYASDVASPAAGYLAALTGALVAIRSTGRMRLGWALIAAGMACTATGDAIWSWYDVVLGAEPPPVSVADVAYIAQIPLTLSGIAAIVATRRPSDTLRTILDGLIIAGSFLYLSWATVLGPAFHAHSDSLADRIVLLAYPIGDLATASMVFIMLGHVHRTLRSSMSLAGAGLVVLAVADSVYAYLSQTGGYESGAVVDAAWFAAFALIALAGARSAAGPAVAAASERDPWRLITLPYAPLAVALVASVVVQAAQSAVGLFLYVNTTVLVLLVVVRQITVLRENTLLTRRLAATVSDLQSREEQLRHLAFHDPLTGLANRALFQNRVQHAIASQPRTGAAVAVLYIDLDAFKAVNDTLGHHAGDELLATVARRLLSCARPTDTVARLGGDEFAVLVEHVRQPGSAAALAGRIVDVLAEPAELPGGEPMRVGASVGVAVRDLGGESASEVLRQADTAMYAAKVKGKGQYVTFEPHMRPGVTV
jgi:diguanylate cyclase (GGDEF)-like protein